MKNSDTRFIPPYKPSWLDHLVGWIDRLKLSNFWFYVLLLFVTIAFGYVISWVSGVIEFGSFNFITSTGGFYTVLPLALYHYLRIVAGDSLDSFRSILNADEHRYNELKYKLQNFPARWGWLLIILGLFIGISDVLERPADYLVTPSSPLHYVLYSVIGSAFFATTFFSLIVQTIRQLSLVNKIHNLPLRFDLFQLHAAHSFSNLSGRAAIGFIIIGIFLSLEPTQTLLNFGIYIVLSILALSAFFLPLVGMYAKIKANKSHAIDEINHHIQAMIHKIQEQVAANDFKDARELNTTLSGLISAKGLLEKIPAWPWDVGIFRGFITTILLPIVLWLIFRVLEGSF